MQKRLAAGETLIMLNPGDAVPPGPLTGAGAIFIDREGTGLDPGQAAGMVSAAGELGLLSVIRSDGLTAAAVQECLDLRPDALVLPQIRGPEDAEFCIGLTRDSATALIAQIETPEAVARLDELAALDGIAGFLIGPFDLARAMGRDGPDDPEVAGAVARVAARLRAAGRPFGLPTLDAAAHDHWTGHRAQLLYVPLRFFHSEEFAPCLSR